MMVAARLLGEFAIGIGGRQADVPRQRIGLLHRESLRLARRWRDLVELDATGEQAALGLAQGLLDDGDRSAALREIDRTSVLRDELGIGLSPEGCNLRAVPLDTPATAAVRPRPEWSL